MGRAAARGRVDCSPSRTAVALPSSDACWDAWSTPAPAVGNTLLVARGVRCAALAELFPAAALGLFSPRELCERAAKLDGELAESCKREGRGGGLVAPAREASCVQSPLAAEPLPADRMLLALSPSEVRPPISFSLPAA
jgi:hypothetical protein